MNKKVLIITLTSFSIITSTLNAKTNSKLKYPEQIVFNYETNGIHSKKDFETFKKAFNKVYQLKNKKIDNITFLKKTYINKNGVINIKKEIKGKKEAKKMIYNVTGQKVNEKVLKKYIYFLAKNISYLDASSLCKQLDKMNYFKYGGELNETVEDKIYNRTFNIIIKNSNDCKKVKKDFEKSIKKFLKFIKDNKQQG